MTKTSRWASPIRFGVTFLSYAVGGSQFIAHTSMSRSTTGAVILLAVALLSTADAFQTGAPFSTCYTRYPKHGGTGTQTSPSPFQITFSPATYAPGDEIAITVKDPNNQKFMGLQIAAFRGTGNPEEFVGQFTTFPLDKLKPITCFGGFRNMLTHKNDDLVESLSLKWRAPSENVGNITFKATVLVDFSTFWTTLEGHLPSSSTNLLAAPKYQVISSSKLVNDIDFAECGEMKGCFLYPQQCDGDDCVAAATFRHRSATDDYLFELFASSAEHYISIGFSHDREMGNDETVSCISNSGLIGVQHGKNPAYHNDRLITRFISEAEVRHADGILQCRFVIPAQTTVYAINQSASDYQYKNTTFDRNNNYRIQLAWGYVMPESDVMSMHREMPAVTYDDVSLSSIEIYRGTGYHVLVRVHVSLMMIAWIVIGGLVTVISRHYKDWLPKQRLFGTKVWFQIHRELAILIVILTAIGLTVIFAHYGAELRTNAGPHSIVGIVVTVLLCLQVLAGFLRPGFESKFRPYFNWGHRIMGQITHILAGVTMFLAFDLNYITNDMKKFGFIVLGIWVAIQLVWHIVFEILSCRGLPLNPSPTDEANKEDSGCLNVASLLLIIYAITLAGLCCACLAAFLLF